LPDPLTSLIDSLGGELTVYRELLALSERKQKLLLEKFSVELQAIVGEEETCIQRLATLEDGRRQALVALTGSPDASLDSLQAKLPPRDFQRVSELAAQLKQVLASIKDINERNQHLLEQALELTHYSLKLITTPPKEVVYRAPGSQRPLSGLPPSLLDRKI